MLLLLGKAHFQRVHAKCFNCSAALSLTDLLVVVFLVSYNALHRLIDALSTRFETLVVVLFTTPVSSAYLLLLLLLYLLFSRGYSYFVGVSALIARFLLFYYRALLTFSSNLVLFFNFMLCCFCFIIRFSSVLNDFYVILLFYFFI